MQSKASKLLSRMRTFAWLSLAGTPLTNVHAVELVCDGVAPAYENGFGTTEIDWNVKTSRFVTVDESTKLAKMMTLFGERSAPLSPVQDQRYYSFTLKHGHAYQGRRIYFEQVTINRVTAEISSSYLFNEDGSLEGLMLAFSGKCKKAAGQF